MYKAVLLRLISARENAGLSQSQAAKLMDLSREQLKMMEEGSSSLSLEQFLTMAETYEVNRSWLIGGVNPSFDPAPVIEALGDEHEDLASILDTLEMISEPDPGQIRIWEERGYRCAVYYMSSKFGSYRWTITSIRTANGSGGWADTFNAAVSATRTGIHSLFSTEMNR